MANAEKGLTTDKQFSSGANERAKAVYGSKKKTQQEKTMSDVLKFNEGFPSSSSFPGKTHLNIQNGRDDKTKEKLLGIIRLTSCDEQKKNKRKKSKTRVNGSKTGEETTRHPTDGNRFVCTTSRIYIFALVKKSIKRPRLHLIGAKSIRISPCARAESNRKRKVTPGGGCRHN